jgi:hypothetical protein
LDKVLPHVASLQQGQQVTLHFNIKGFNGQKGNFTGLEIWKVEAAQAQQAAPQQAQPMQQPPTVDPTFEMPF